MNIMKLVGDFNIRKANHRSEASTIRRVSTVINDKSTFLVREAYNSARTNIIYSLTQQEEGGKKILITSASPHEGKTTTCLNLAITFAQTEAKVLIIDADLRKPRINRHLSIDRQNGLSDYLCGLISLDEAIKKCPNHNLDCITSGQIPPNPTELLSSSKMGELLTELAKRYDYIFLDSPPITVVSEAMVMSKYVSGVILVVRQNSTIHESIKRAKTILDMANVKLLGFILNDVNPSRYGYGSGYGRYSYRRSYGYSYGNYGNGGYGYGYGYGYSHRYGKSYGYGKGQYGYGYGYKKYGDYTTKKYGDNEGSDTLPTVTEPKKISLFKKKEKPEKPQKENKKK